eukprot:CAMPEP_0177434336 /NCGR_PEP_ID=MMETSP0369-20130122/392_1 /TAXON_ID=447022 ORGANISM="Scrippsiella hangoei-like, Strain SHHI-4" /NCGR_SAMPLE_ID=MMETSP0369 /ASSEMBLY_ACC=CAM_ASM_000364 /LENGTH=188 /DNA_ID=CAMNT_0018905279 /DNA_START=499 /DNA_END=1065 /DNA_ORIENTATION=-
MVTLHVSIVKEQDLLRVPWFMRPLQNLQHVRLVMLTLRWVMLTPRCARCFLQHVFCGSMDEARRPGSEETDLALAPALSIQQFPEELKSEWSHVQRPMFTQIGRPLLIVTCLEQREVEVQQHANLIDICFSGGIRIGYSPSSDSGFAPQLGSFRASAVCRTSAGAAVMLSAADSEGDAGAQKLRIVRE